MTIYTNPPNDWVANDIAFDQAQGNQELKEKFDDIDEALGFAPLRADKLSLLIAWATVATIDIDADSLNLYKISDSFSAKGFTAINLTVDIAATGANGRNIDTAEQANKWYAIYVIGKVDGTVAGFLVNEDDLGGETYPAGYIYRRRIGWVRNDAGSDLLKGYWYNGGEEFWWDVPPSLYSSVANDKPVVYTDLDCSSFTPPTANRIILNISITSRNHIFMRRNGATGTGTTIFFDCWYSDSIAVVSLIDLDDNQIFEWAIAASAADRLDFLERGYKDNF